LVARAWGPLKNQNKLNKVSKPLHPSTNPEILVKIVPLASELRGLESRPLKKNLKIRKNIGKIYSPSGKFAERAKLVVRSEKSDVGLAYDMYSTL